jgi:replication factor A1
MQHLKTHLYEKVKDIYSKEDFFVKVEKLRTEYDDLLDEDIAALFIVDEAGRNTENIYKIKDVEDRIDCSIFGKVTNIQKARTFSRKNGSSGRVVNLELSDETGSINLALWDKDVDLVKNKKIKVGTSIKVINGYVKTGYKGLELNTGKYSQLIIEPEDIPKEVETSNQISDKIKGKLIEIEPSKAFFKDDGEFGFVTNIKIKTNDKINRIAVWNEKVKEIQKFKKGDEIEIQNINYKNGNKEFHVNGNAIIKKI